MSNKLLFIGGKIEKFHMQLSGIFSFCMYFVTLSNGINEHNVFLYVNIHKFERYMMWLNNTSNSNTIRCKKLAIIVSGRKYVVRPFVRRKQLSTSAKIYSVSKHISFEGSCYVHCSKQLEEQTKKWRKTSETPMYWYTMDSTRVLMRNTEKRRKKIWN